MTVLLATSVVRGSQQGDSHGGAFLVDFEARIVRQMLDWNRIDIDWQGRGWDRGLRGIAFSDDGVLLAASDELMVFDAGFRLLASYRNACLKHCHEIVRQGDMVFLTSTGFDCILGFDLSSRRFTWGLHLAGDGDRIRASAFDPEGDGRPEPSNAFHLNSVSATDRGLFIAGLRTPGLLRFGKGGLSIMASLPAGTHNAQPLRNGIVFNDTEADAVRFVTPSRQRTFDVPRYPVETLTQTSADQAGIARQAFGRGLCMIGENLIAAGSSPATIALHDIDDNRTLSMVTLSTDVRTAIHALAVWPFD
jgi:hypothetical protein